MKDSKEQRKPSSLPRGKMKSSFFAPTHVQPKLTVNKPGDKYEQEADKVAEIVVSQINEPPSSSSRSNPEANSKLVKSTFFKAGNNSNTSPIQSKCETCEANEKNEKEDEVQMKTEPNSFMKINGEDNGNESTLMAKKTPTSPSIVSDQIAHQLNSSKGSGNPMPRSTKSDMEQGFGLDFSSVRIHTDSIAANLNKDIGAQAFTYGSDIYFNSGKFESHSQNGKRLLAHELTHVVQQRERGSKLEKKEIPSIQKQDANETASSPLSQEDRSFLYDRITFRMGLAYNKFVDACNSHQRDIREQAAQNAAFASLVLDIALAFATRGISRVISAGISGAVRREASEAVYRIAMGALDRADDITAAATTVGKEIAKRGFESIFSRSEDEQFVQNMKQVMSESLDAIHGNMQNNSDEELSILFFNYDPSLATINYYEQRLAQMLSAFRDQIAPIGDRTDERYGVIRLRWIEGRNRRALALTGEGRYFMTNGRARFMAWITPFFREEALRRSQPLTESDYPIIHYGRLESGSTPANIEFILNSPYLTSDDFVFAASTGQTPVNPNPCPSCHGETGGSQAPSFPDRSFDFPSLIEPENHQLLQEWLRQSQQ